MKRLIIAFTGLLVFTINSCSSTAEKKAAPEVAPSTTSVTLTDLQIKNATVVVGSFSDHSINETLQLNGTVDVPPQNIVSISFPLGGYLKSTKLLPGMHVFKGESIGIIEDQTLVQLQQDYLMAKSKLSFSKLEYERQKSLNETKTAADKIFQQAQSDYENTKLLVLGLGEKLRLININPDKLSGNSISRMVSIPSPINGFVSKVNVNIGKYVQPQDVLFELINPTDLHAALTVFEKDLNKIKQGQKVEIYFVDEPNKKYDAEVILVTKNIDENRTGTIHCHFENLPGNLKPGMYINATINLSNSVVKALPEDAVVRYENKEWIFIEQEKNKFESVTVITGKRNDGWIEIISTTDSLINKQVVIKNAFAVLSAMKNVAED
jgi:cobalt-zinc-cadmium efflux system membrane fusion protein